MIGEPCSSLAYPPRSGISACRVFFVRELPVPPEASHQEDLTDTSFVVLEGPCGDPFMESCRHGRGV
jgi:hypothetical protein